LFALQRATFWEMPTQSLSLPLCPSVKREPAIPSRLLQPFQPRTVLSARLEQHLEARRGQPQQRWRVEHNSEPSSIYSVCRKADVLGWDVGPARSRNVIRQMGHGAAGSAGQSHHGRLEKVEGYTVASFSKRSKLKNAGAETALPIDSGSGHKEITQKVEGQTEQYCSDEEFPVRVLWVQYKTTNRGIIMTPNKSLSEEPPNHFSPLAGLQHTLDEERRDNIVHRLGCASDCREHFPMRLLTSFTERATRVESWANRIR
jgi:hypothetical protein